jgi:hypothetical protein
MAVRFGGIWTRRYGGIVPDDVIKVIYAMLPGLHRARYQRQEVPPCF